MRTRPIELYGAEWANLFATARSAFRLETLQEYTTAGEAEQLARFLAGEEVDFESGREGWLRLIQRIRMSRVHVIFSDLTGYLRFELRAQRLSVKAGEDIRLLEVEEASGHVDHLTATAIAFGDFWLFNGWTLVRLQYDGEGRPTGATIDKNPLAVWRARRLQRQLLRAAVPYRDYMEKAGSLAATGS